MNIADSRPRQEYLLLDLFRRIRHHIVAYLIIMSATAGIFYIIVANEFAWQTAKYQEKSQALLRNIDNQIQRELSMMTSDLLQIAHDTSIISTIQKQAGSKSDQEAIRSLLTFMRYNRLYDQLRFLDNDGMERFLINNTSDTPVVVPASDLQSKAGRYYVDEALRLSTHEVYISEVDLNKEHGKIELPYKPTLRIATVIHDQGEKKVGLLVLNIDFQRLIDTIILLNNTRSSSLYLSNGMGQWLVAPKGQKAWSFMFEKTGDQIALFSTRLREAMRQTETGSIEEDDGSVLGYRHINPLDMLQLLEVKLGKTMSDALIRGLDDSRLQWWLVQQASKQYIAEKAWENIFKGLPYLISGMVIILILTSYMILLYHRIINSNKQLRLIETSFEHADDGMLITDAKINIIRVNTKYEAITGYSAEELIGNNPKLISSGWTDEATHAEMWDAIHTKDYWEGELHDRRKDGAIYTQWLRIIALKDDRGQIINYFGVATDITKHKEDQQRIHKLAFEDTLTGLPNRQLFQDRLGHAIASSERSDRPVALMFVDLDDFKLINDTAGHMAGDNVLIEISRRLESILRESDTLARIGGDEFVILFENTDQMQVLKAIERIQMMLSKSVEVGDQEYFVSSSIGVAFYPDDAADAQALLQHADTAMYKAKEGGKNGYCLFEAAMNDDVTRRLRMTKDLKDAVDSTAFSLVYQPQISLDDGQVIGAEALLRWEVTGRDPISPADFIPLAESTGLIVPITMWVLENVCDAIKRIRHECGKAITIAVNISSVHLKEQDFVNDIHDFVKSMDVRPEDIELEITEGALIDDIRGTVDKLEQLKAFGYRIAIDDFGTGYSSLSYLKQFGFEQLKIDRAFVKELPDDVEDVSITKSIIAIGKALGMRLVAEGAETEQSVAFLREHGCDMVQGYYFSRPLPLDAFIAYTKDPKDSMGLSRKDD